MECILTVQRRVANTTSLSTTMVSCIYTKTLLVLLPNLTNFLFCNSSPAHPPPSQYLYLQTADASVMGSLVQALAAAVVSAGIILAPTTVVRMDVPMIKPACKKDARGPPKLF